MARRSPDPARGARPSHKSTWESDSKAYPNICNLPGQEAGPDREDLFGNCIYTCAPQFRTTFSLCSSRRTPLPGEAFGAEFSELNRV